MKCSENERLLAPVNFSSCAIRPITSMNFKRFENQTMHTNIDYYSSANCHLAFDHYFRKKIHSIKCSDCTVEQVK